MTSHKAKIRVIVEGNDGSSITLDAIASRIASFDELGAKVAVAVQTTVDGLIANGRGKTVAESREVAAS